MLMRFEVERQAQKPAERVVASLLHTLWSVISACGVATQVGAEVRPDVVKTEDNRATCVRSCECNKGLPEQK